MIASIPLDAVQARPVVPTRTGSQSAEESATVAAAAAKSARPVGVRPTAEYYVSPILTLDTDSQRVILKYRDTSNGETVNQYPSKKQLDAYRSSEPEQQAEPKAGKSTDKTT